MDYSAMIDVVGREDYSDLYEKAVKQVEAEILAEGGTHALESAYEDDPSWIEWQADKLVEKWVSSIEHYQARTTTQLAAFWPTNGVQSCES